MSKQAEYAEVLGIVLGILGIALVVGGLIYGLFIYNNTQNIKRDEFYATHCKTVANVPAAFNNEYQCH